MFSLDALVKLRGKIMCENNTFSYVHANVATTDGDDVKYDFSFLSPNYYSIPPNTTSQDPLVLHVWIAVAGAATTPVNIILSNEPILEEPTTGGGIG